MKKIILGLLILVIGFSLITFLFPSEVTISREIIISKPVNEVFPLVNDLKNWEKWSPWKKMDPDGKVEYSSQTIGEGAWYTWASEKPEVGHGKQTITKSIKNQVIETKLEFRDWPDAEAQFNFEEQPNQIKLVWSFKTQSGYNPIERTFNLFLDDMLGPVFEEGLSNIKKIASKMK